MCRQTRQKADNKMNEHFVWNGIYARDKRPAWEEDDQGKTLAGLMSEFGKKIEKKEVRVLDIGCGNGRNSRLTEALPFSPVHYTGIDFSKRTIADCSSMYKNHTFIRADFTKPTTLDEESFDIIIDNGCFHSILPELREKYIENIVKTAAPGAFLFLNCWYKADKKQGLIEPSFRPFVYIAEWFFDEEDIQKFFAPSFSLEKFVLCHDKPFDIMNGFLFTVLKKVN